MTSQELVAADPKCDGSETLFLSLTLALASVKNLRSSGVTSSLHQRRSLVWASSTGGARRVARISGRPQARAPAIHAIGFSNPCRYDTDAGNFVGGGPVRAHQEPCTRLSEVVVCV